MWTARMDVMGFTALVSSEKKARRYFLDFCWKNHQRFCPRCRERKLYHVADDRRRCSRCGYTFHDFSGRFVNACAFDSRQWLWFLKLFELATPPREIAVHMGISYATVLKAQDAIRRAIVASSLDAKFLYRAGIWPGPGRPRHAQMPVDSPIFGVIELNGMIICDALPGITPEALLHFKCNFRLKTASLGQVVYTAPYQRYFMLAGCGPVFWPTRLIRHEDKGLLADSSDFWAFAKRHLVLRRGVAPANFPLHLKELELRYNFRGKSLLPVLAKALCGFVPDG